MPSNNYSTKEEVLAQAQIILNQSLRNIIPTEKLSQIEKQLIHYGSNRKGLLGELIELYVFGKPADGRSEADFSVAGVELKTTPLKKHPR